MELNHRGLELEHMGTLQQEVRFSFLTTLLFYLCLSVRRWAMGQRQESSIIEDPCSTIVFLH